MKTLADEILDLLSDEPLSAKHIAKALAADPISVREAIKQLDEDGRAKWIVRGAGGSFFAISNEYKTRVCIMCHKEFFPRKGPKSIARTCSNRCKMDLARAARDREAFVARVRETSSRPKNVERLRESIKTRHEFMRSEEGRNWLAERNRKDWSDPYRKAKRSVAISKRLKSKESSKKLSDNMRARFKDPEMRKKICDAMRGVKRSPEACAAMSERQRARGRRLRQQYLETDEARMVMDFMESGMSVSERARELGVPRHWLGTRVKKIKQALAERNEQHVREAA